MTPWVRVFFKRLSFAGTFGVLAAVLVRALHLEIGVVSYLDKNEFVSSFNLLHKAGGASDVGSASVLIYAATFVLVALAAYGAAAWKPIDALLGLIFRDPPIFLRRPERRVEPFLAALGLTQPLAFYGRKGELAALDRFAAHPERFLWWSMHGPGGVGKTRLSVEWMLRSAELRGSMDVGFLDREATTLTSVRAFRPRRPTIIVADEALLFAPQIWSYIVELANHASSFRHTVRLLLIDWEPLAEPTGEVASALDSLSMQALTGSRHYEVLRQSSGKPELPGRPRESRVGPRLTGKALPSFEMVEVSRPMDSLLIRPFDDRLSIEALIADASRGRPPADPQAIMEATEGNPLLIVAAALSPDQPPYRVIEGIARKMLHRARPSGPHAGVHMPTILCLAALSGPIEPAKCADLAAGLPKPAQLVKYFPLSRNEMRSALPALEPELLAHEVILQHMSELDPPQQAALAGACLGLNEPRALRVIGNLWARRAEARHAVALACSLSELAETSGVAMDYAHVLNVLAEAAEKSPGYAASQIRPNRGLAALAMLSDGRLAQGRDQADSQAGSGGGEIAAPIPETCDDERIAPILSYALGQILDASQAYAAIFEGLPIAAEDAAAVASSLLHAFVVDRAAARQRSELTLAPMNNERIFTALEHGSSAAAVAACLELMEFGYQNRTYLQPAERLDVVERLLPILCRAVHVGPANLRIAAAWACQWLLQLGFSGGVRATLDDDRKRALLDDLGRETTREGVDRMIALLTTALGRPEPSEMLLTWCERIDAGREPLPLTLCERPVGGLRDAFAAELKRRASEAPGEEPGARIGSAAISVDALDVELLPHLDTHLRSESSGASQLIGACALIGTSGHPMAVEILQKAFSEGASTLRFGAFLGLWARREWSFLTQQESRPDDPVDYKAAMASPGGPGIEFITHLYRLTADWVHRLKAKDTTGRWAYYFVHVAPERDHIFLSSLEGDAIVDLETFGSVVGSCYGEEPTEELLTSLRSHYGYVV
ncbi:MAG TPA: hypothetical protein VGD66_11810 [Allosphingosinicella sp.]|jgi:hypothetical protein